MLLHGESAPFRLCVKNDQKEVGDMHTVLNYQFLCPKRDPWGILR